MPRRVGDVVYMERMSLEARAALGDGFQRHWYAHVAKGVSGLDVLDVGAGTGYGISVLLAGGARAVRAIDPLPCGPGVVTGTVETEPVDGYDYVVAMDVIEHVDDDVGFFRHLLRSARVGVFLSTPNWDYFHAENPHHVREYTPLELEAFVAGYRVEVWTSDAACAITAATFQTAKHNFGLLVHKS